MSTSGLPKRPLAGTDDSSLLDTASKRWRTSHNYPEHDRAEFQTLPTTKLSNGSYTVGWICALPLEMAAARAMLDYVHDDLPKARIDINQYTLGSIGRQNVVITCLPKDGYGTNNAANVASHMRRSFPSIYMLLMVGIGGGVPGKVDIRLGDVVVGTRVVQYDLGKTITNGHFLRTESSFTPSPTLLTTVSKLDAIHKATPSKIPMFLSEMLNRNPEMVGFRRRDSFEDLLFESDYDHNDAYDNCQQCDRSKLVQRGPRADLRPAIHYGKIASGNRVIKHGWSRDQLAQELDNICFEMETAGLMGDSSCLAVRGICDYADSHKNKEWQEYAAATAAAYAKELLLVMSPERSVEDMPTDSPLYIRERVSKQDQREHLLNSLRFKHIDARELSIKAAHGDTCKWLLEHPQYLKWLDPEQYADNHGFLWIKGKPGAGKSTMMKFLHQRTKPSTTSNVATIKFFFNARGDDLEKSTRGMYMSLLLQLLERFPDLQEVIEEPQFERLLPREYNDNKSWDIDVLQDIFSAAIEKLGNRVLFCFIDALDECDKEQVQDMVDYLEDLGERAMQTGVKLYVCFSSRPYPEVSFTYGRELTLEDQDGHSKDLEKFVWSKFKAGSGELFEKTREEIIQKAAGIFMWVVLVVHLLNEVFKDGDIFRVEDRLKEIPAGLTELFRDILKRDDVKLCDFLLCIQWTLYAKQPLTCEEYYLAMVSGLDQAPEKIAGWNPKRISKRDLRRFVLSSSKGLAEVTKTKYPVVQFIHESVRDYLLKDKGLWELWPELDTDIESLSHNRLKQCCRTYMAVNLPRCRDSVKTLPPAPTYEAKRTRERVSQQYPFLEYAIHFVLYHANVAAKKFPQDETLLDFPLEDWIFINNILQKYDIRRHTGTASLLYVLAENNCARLVRTLAQYQPPTDIEGGRYRYPLFAALANGHRDAVAALLHENTDHDIDQGITTHLKYGKDFKVPTVDSPLTWAVINGDEPIVKALLATNLINVNEKDRQGQTALLYALGSGQESLARLLLSSDQVDIEKICSEGNDPLSWAVRCGNNALVRLLVETFGLKVDMNNEENALIEAAQSGQEANVKLLIETSEIDMSKYGPAILYHAVRGGHEAVIKTLLAMGQIQPDKKTRWSDWYLPVAARAGNEPVVKLLLEAGYTDINRPNPFGDPSLCLAAGNGHEAIVRILLRTGRADIDIKNNIGDTPLSLAAEGGHEAVVKLLLKTGQADVNAKNKDSETPLFAAVGNKHEAITELLLKTGWADINVKGVYGRTPLYLAAREGQAAIVKLMLETGQADINAKDNFNETPLLLAVTNKHEAIVELLLRTGQADINAKNDFGVTPLLIAVIKKHEAIVELLLRTGRADINAKDDAGRTPLTAARYKNMTTIYEMLMRYSTQHEPQ